MVLNKKIIVDLFFHIGYIYNIYCNWNKKWRWNFNQIALLFVMFYCSHEEPGFRALWQYNRRPFVSTKCYLRADGGVMKETDRIVDRTITEDPLIVWCRPSSPVTCHHGPAPNDRYVSTRNVPIIIVRKSFP